MFREEEVELYRLKWGGVLAEEELSRCLEEASRTTGDILTAHLCAAQIAASRRPPETAEGGGEGETKERRAERRVEIQRVPWQIYASLAIALVALLPVKPAVLALAPVPALLYAVMRNTVPFWREGGTIVWKSPLGPVRLKAYRIAAIFKDVHGMGPLEFANAVRAYAQSANGIWYDGRSAYVLVKEGREEDAKTSLRRIGVIVGEEVEPTAVPPKAPIAPYLLLALLPAILAFWNPAVVVPVAISALMTLFDRGAAVRGAINDDKLIAAVLKEEELQSLAKTSQLSVRSAVVMWIPWPQFYETLQKSASRSEFKAKILGSMWRWLQTEVLHAVRQRVLNRAESAYLVAGLIEGELAAFGKGPYRPTPALALDFAEVTPFSFMLVPFNCGQGSVKVGIDDVGREVCFRPEDLESPHMIVVGKTGSGKTTWTQAVARQLAARGAKVVAIDPHGHWKGAKINAKRYVPPLVVTTDDVDFILDILRAAGTAVYDVHYTVLYSALERCGGSASLSKLPDCVLAVRDLSNAWAVDGIYGRLLSLARSEVATVPSADVVVVHTEGDSSPGDVMRLITWLYYFVAQAKRTCPNPPCPLRIVVAIDEAHVLLKHLDALVKAYREVRKFGVIVATMTQSVRDVPRDVIENSGVVAVLAIDPSALQETAYAVHIDPKVLERVAVESLPEERIGVVRFGGRAPIFVRLAK